MIIKIQNSLDTIAQVTYLTQQENLGTTTFHVRNATGFGAASWAVQAGKTGEEKSEIILLSGAPSGTTMAFATASALDHPTDTPVYAIKYDKIIFNRSTSGTAGTPVPFSSSTVAITPDSPYTQLDDTSGASTYAYKTQYYNSVTAGTSTLSDWITPAGYDFCSLAKIRQRIRNKLYNSTYIPDDSIIDDWTNEYLEMMTNNAIDVDESYSMGTVNLSFSGTVELGTITSADFKQIARMWITNDGGVNYYKAQKIRLNEYDPQQIFNASLPRYYMYDETVVGRKPSDTSGTASIHYYKLQPVLVNETDLLPQSMRGYTNGFVEYGLAMAFQKDNKPDVYQLHWNNAMSTLEKFKKEITPRNKTGPSFINIIEPIGNEDGLWM